MCSGGPLRASSPARALQPAQLCDLGLFGWHKAKKNWAWYFFAVCCLFFFKKTQPRACCWYLVCTAGNGLAEWPFWVVERGLGGMWVPLKLLQGACTASVVLPGRLFRPRVGKRKTTRSCSPHNHNRLMLSARAPQNHKLNFKCRTSKTVLAVF